MADRGSKRLSRLVYNDDKPGDSAKGKAAAAEEAFTPPARVGFEDMTKMEDMSLDGVLENLRLRYEANLIYTYTSSILVAINPFKRLPIYGKQWVKFYKGSRLGLLAPHIYAVAEQTYNAMVEHLRNQSVLVSGESGAGKTECTKLILQFLCARTDRVSNIDTMVLESVPVLEAFGNAKTGRNDNSSRFGKFIEIQFDNDFGICGSNITPYLLEKSRLISQAKGERNYHIFYQLTEGATDSDREKFKIGHAKEYQYLNKTGCISIRGVDEAEELQQLRAAFEIFEVTEEIQDNIFRIVAACLHLGNIDWKAGGDGAIPVDDKAMGHAQTAAELLDVEGDALVYALTHKKIQMRNEIIFKPLTFDQAKDQTHSLTKYLYSEMFEWMVKKLNECTYTEKSQSFIGVLDIFGFELFEHNSFEQFLINFANEKLQNFFNHHIFQLEQIEYEKENIDWTQVDFVDNQPCLDLIEQRRPPGILAILDEESKFPRATDESFFQKLVDNFDGKHDYFEKPRMARDKFITKHFAGPVEYEIPGWRDKNKDELPENLLDLIRGSSNKFVAILYSPYGEDGPPPDADDKKKGSKMTLGMQFKNQLTALMTMLGETDPYFIRCVKPNMEKVPNKFDEQLIYNQLLYAGMLETIKIRRMGYPIRYPNADFWKRYRVICPEVAEVRGDPKASALKLAQALGINNPSDYQPGLTKVFLKQETANQLEDRRNVALTDIILKLQTWWRGAFPRHVFLTQRTKAVVIQTWWRRAHARKVFKGKCAGARKIQAWWRMVVCMRERKKLAEEKRIREEEERRRKEEERQRLIKEKGEAEAARLMAEEERAVSEAQAAEDEKIRALAAGEIEFGKKEEAPAPAAGDEDGGEGSADGKKKKKKKKRLDKDARGSIMMSKGQQLEVPINVDGRITLGLGWKGGQWDMDASCLMFRYKQHRDDVYYYKPRSKDGSVTHRGGYAGLIRVNPEEGDAEQIDVNLQKVSAKTNTLIFVVTVFSPEGNFSSVQDAYVRLLDTATQSEYCRYTLDSSGDETARIMCRLYRYGFSKWRLQAIGEPSQGRLYKHMIPRVEPFLDDMPRRRKFRIRIHRGNLNDIKQMYEGGGKAHLNTFVEVRYDTDKAKGKVVKKSLQPKWRATVEVRGHSHVLELNIMHKVSFGKDVTKRLDYSKVKAAATGGSVFLGRCLIPIGEIDNVQITEQWFKLEQREKSKAQKGMTAVTGEIKLTIQELLI